MIRFLVAAVLAFAAAQPALAHKLKVFATVEGEAVTGYAFFIGGGRAMGAKWSAVEGKDTTLGNGRTDDKGGFRLVPPQPVTSEIRITVDTEEGHVAFAVLPASRFGGVEDAAPSTETVAATAPAPSPQAEPEEIARLVDAAVQRQVEPLLERIEQMDSRLRFTDILSGIFLIVGLAGMALWARGRMGGSQ